MKLDKDMYTIQEVADLFEVTKPTVYDWMNRRGLKWVQLGARRRITRAAIEEFVREGASHSDAASGTMDKEIRRLDLVALPGS